MGRIGTSLPRSLRRPRLFSERLRSIQSWLDRHYPTLTLRQNMRTGAWIITDLPYHDNGQPGRYFHAPAQHSNRGALGGPRVREHTVIEFMVRDHSINGEGTDYWSPFPPSLSVVKRMLVMKAGGLDDDRVDQLLQSQDDFQEREEQDAMREWRDAGRATAEEAYRRAARGTVTMAGGKVTDQRKVNRDIHRRILKEQQEDLREENAELEAAVREDLAAGRGFKIR